MPGYFPVYVEIKARGSGATLLVTRVVNIIRQYGRWESTPVGKYDGSQLQSLGDGLSQGHRTPDYPRLHLVKPSSPALASTLAEPTGEAPLASPGPAYLAPRVAGQISFPGKANGCMGPGHKRVFSKHLLPQGEKAGLRGVMGYLREIGLDAAATDHPEALVRQKHSITP